MRRRGPVLRHAGPLATAALLCALGAGCKAPPDLRPDEVLIQELGLTERDRVHRIALSGGDFEAVEPREVQVRRGAYVAFVTTDWRVHEVLFELDSLGADARAFLERTDQAASPPLLRLDSRFVVSFDEAPSGRYPFLVEGNTAPGRGVVVVVEGG